MKLGVRSTHHCAGRRLMGEHSKTKNYSFEGIQNAQRMITQTWALAL